MLVKDTLAQVQQSAVKPEKDFDEHGDIGADGDNDDDGIGCGIVGYDQSVVSRQVNILASTSQHLLQGDTTLKQVNKYVTVIAAR